MMETQIAQAMIEESSRCRGRFWLSMVDQKRFDGIKPQDVVISTGGVINKNLNASKASSDGLIHIGQKVYLPGDLFIGLIQKIFLDANGHVSHIAIRIARIFGRYKIVPFQCVRNVTSLHVHLSIDYEQFKALVNYQTDSAITENADRALWNDSVLRFTDYNQIDVRVRDGIVILNGHVNSSMNLWRAETAVKNIPGNIGMKSFLIPDDRLTLEVAGVLGQFENVENSKLFSKVDNGVAVLVGEVSTASIRDQAEQRVAAIPWIRGVINEICVPGMKIDLGDQRFLQPRIGKELIFKDGLSGTIQSVVIDPHNRRVVSVVLLGQFPDPQQKPKSADHEENSREQLTLQQQLVVLPARLILHLTRSGGTLQINSTETTQYEGFVPSRYSVPDRDWLPPYPYCADEVLFRVE